MSEYKTVEAVHNRALEIVGKPMGELERHLYLTTRGKSSVGDIFEAWFGKPKDSESKPDLEEAGVELKATPYKQLKSGLYSAKERLVLNIINYNQIVNEDFDSSHFMFKNNTIELAFYEYLSNHPKDDWTIDYVALFQMAKDTADFEIIKRDWTTIQSYVRNGQAEDLSEGLTQYLAACTKGASSRSVRSQPYSDVYAKQRAFSLKASYMTALLRNHIMGNQPVESIVKNRMELKSKSLDDIILERFNRFANQNVSMLMHRFGVESTAKSKYSILAGKMLDLSGDYKGGLDALDRVDEFAKGGYHVKTVVFDSEGKNKESMSLPPFKFKELVNEKWNDDDGVPSATFHNYLLDSTFILFVMQYDSNGTLVFKGVKLMRIPENIIEKDARFVWQDTKNKADQGIHLTVKPRGEGQRVVNNLIPLTAHRTFHVRNHATKSDYSANGKYSDQLPVSAVWGGRNGDTEEYADDWIATMSFWINKDYIRSQALELLS